jgi:hypothetical protein
MATSLCTGRTQENKSNARVARVLAAGAVGDVPFEGHFLPALPLLEADIEGNEAAIEDAARAARRRRALDARRRRRQDLLK